MNKLYTIFFTLVFLQNYNKCVAATLRIGKADTLVPSDKSILKSQSPSPSPDLFIKDEKLLNQIIYTKKIIHLIENNSDALNSKISIADLITEAKSSNYTITRLDLSKKNLTTFPVEILQLVDLEYLDLSNNKIESIPREISELSKLKSLSINNNNIDTVPTSLFEIKSLEFLKLENNSPNLVLPSNINNLSNLTTFWVSDVKDFPTSFWELTQLKNIRLWNSNITELPIQIKNFKHLDEICLRGNNLKTLPDELFSLKRLTYLSVPDNKIEFIPDKINKLSRLDYLGIYGNSIGQLNLKRKTLKSLRFISAWNTSISKEVLQKIERKAKHKNIIQTLEESH